jgi:hypothetical protein
MTIVMGAVVGLIATASGWCQPPRPTVRLDASGAWAFPAFTIAGGMSQYVFDWGDGTQGLGSPVNPGSPSRAVHVWTKPGRYAIRARCSPPSGAASDWSDPCPIDVATAHDAPRPLSPLTLSTPSGHPEQIIVDLSTPRTVNQIALYPLPKGEGFPAAFSVDYCTDAGKTWYAIPRYTGVNYPNPGDETVLLETGLLVARQIRVTGAAGQAFRLRGISLLASRQAPFFTSLSGAPSGTFDADLNNLWNICGLASNEITPKGDAWWDGLGGALAFGSTDWHEWDVMKLCWTDDRQYVSRVGQEIRIMPMDPDGYVWACDVAPLHLNAQKHFDLNSLHIIAALKYYLWTGEPGFFTDPLPAEVRAKLPVGATTMLDRLRLEMAYQLDVLHGSEGLLRITEPGYDGTPTSKGTTYWDAYPAGYLSAYPNALFYASVKAMAEIERIAGDPAHRDSYLKLLPLIKQRFNRTFWNEDKGRFVSTIDVNGVVYDYGITSTNLYAIVYGVADDTKASRVMEWLSGKRIVAGDTAQGADIYHWRIAPRANTVAFESVKPYWWAGGFAGVYLDPGAWGQWGVNIQNGGAVFYVSYYDILARLRTTGADDAFFRLEAIMHEFNRNELRPEKPGYYGQAGTPAFGVGVWVSFPESGLVPLTMLYGFLGVEPTAEGLRIHPSLPSQLTFAGVRDVFFRGDYYTITARRDVKTMSMREATRDHFEVTVPNGQTSLIAPPARAHDH